MQLKRYTRRQPDDANRRHWRAYSRGSADALIDAGSGPRQIEVHDGRNTSKRQPFAEYVRCDEQPDTIVPLTQTGIEQPFDNFVSRNHTAGDLRGCTAKQCDASVIPQMTIERARGGVELRECNNRLRAPPGQTPQHL